MQKLKFERLFLNLRISTKEQIYANKENKFVQTDARLMQISGGNICERSTVFGNWQIRFMQTGTFASADGHHKRNI